MSQNQPAVSVCMITYNHEQYIRQAIEGVLIQKCSFSIELVIGEDCSTDNTKQICGEYAKLYPHIKMLSSDNNLGMMPNLMRTLKACKGEYIAFCEGDDYWTDPNKLQIQINAMKQYPECNMSFHAAIRMTNKGEKMKWNYSNNIKLFSVNDVFRSPGQFAPTSSYIIKTTIIEKLPIWFQSAPLGDFFLEVYGALNGGILYIQNCMSVYRAKIDVSWSRETLSDIYNIKVLNFYQRMERYLQLLKDDLLYEYGIEIDKKVAAVIYGQSLFYLATGNFGLFKNKIEKSYSLFNNVSIVQKILYCLRNFGKIARFVYISKIKFYNA